MVLNATIFGQALAFLIFVLFCMKYVWPPLIRAITLRQGVIAEGIAASERGIKSLATAQLAAAETIKKAREDAEKILVQAEKQSVALIGTAREDAEKERERILRQAALEIEAERKRVATELREQLGSLVVLGVQRILEREIDPSVHEALINNWLTESNQ